jgi:hypothetical protein
MALGTSGFSSPRLCLFAVMAIMLTTLAGCGDRPITAEWFKLKNSYDYEGQKVELNVLTRDELITYAERHYAGSTVQLLYEKRLKRDFPGLFVSDPAAEAAPLALLAGYAIDVIKAELEREASLYEAQFGESVHKDGFWDEQGKPRLFGIEVVRRTSRDASYNNQPASRIVFAIMPAGMSRWSEGSDDRLFLIKPILVDVNRSLAKVSQFGNKTLDLNGVVRIDATWISKDEIVRQGTVADGKFEFTGVNLATDTVYVDELTDKIACWFAGVPASAKRSGEAFGTGKFQLTVSITEKDPSKVREIIERSAKFLGDKKAQIVERIGGDK